MSADRWSDDWDGHGVQSIEIDDWDDAQFPLTRRQLELRDGIAPPPPNEGAARARRIERMQHEIALCADFVADCDRYRDAMNNYPDPCLTPLIPKLMGRHLDDLRAHAVATGRRLRDELATLRANS